MRVCFGGLDDKNQSSQSIDTGSIRTIMIVEDEILKQCDATVWCTVNLYTQLVDTVLVSRKQTLDATESA